MPCLWMVETVAKDKVASALNRAWGNQKHGSLRPLRVMVQVNTSEESSKYFSSLADVVCYCGDTAIAYFIGCWYPFSSAVGVVVSQDVV